MKNMACGLRIIGVWGIGMFLGAGLCSGQDSRVTSKNASSDTRVSYNADYGTGGEDLSRFGREWESIKNEWNAEKAQHSQRVAEIQKQFPEGPRRQAALEAENARHLNKSRDLGARRNAIHQKVIEEANRRTAGGTTEASKNIRETTGTKPGEKGYRGVPGDMDTGAGARTADAVDGVLKEMGIQVNKKTHGGTVEYGDDFNLTINKEGQMGRAGSGAHQTQVGVDARNPETYVSEGMSKNQPGRKAVEVQDHIKKGTEALNAPPDKVASNPDLQQKMAKTAHKVMNTGTVGDEALGKILKESGINESPQEFKERMERIKEGRAKPGDITPENAGKLQEATRRIADTATKTSSKMANAEMQSTRERIAELERKGTPKAKAEAQKLREQLVDSKVRIEETQAANREKLGGSADVDGPGGRVTDADGPGRGPRDVDGPGLKGGAPETPGKMQQVGKVIGDYMEGVMILEQAEKIREGIKTGDSTKIAQGLAGDDLGKRTEMEGAKDMADAMGDLEKSKKAEADMAEITKLKRMGATPSEIAAYQSAKEAGDLAKAREIAHDVRDRGGKDNRGGEGLEGAPPEDSGWHAKDQLAEGAKQAGSYLEWGANVLSGGFTGKGQAAVEDANELSGLADDLDEKTKEQVRQNLINKLAGTGELSVKDARDLVDKLEHGDREEFDRVVGELKEKGAFEKTKGKYGLTPNEGVDIPETDYKQEAKDTLTNLKETFVDKPAGIINSIVEDSLEATVGSDKYANERNEAERNKELKGQYQTKYDGLIREGATPEQAKQALDGPMGSVNKLLRDLREQRKQRERESADKNKEDGDSEGGKGKTAKSHETRDPKTEKSDSESDRITSDIFDSRDPKTSGRHDFAHGGHREPYNGPVNDGGQHVDASQYGDGDTVVTADGSEWEKKNGKWTKTGNNYGPYSPKDGLKGAEPPGEASGDDESTGSSGGSYGLSGFTKSRGERVDNHTKDSYGLMSDQKGIADASTSSEQAEQESKTIVNAAGNDAQATGAKSATSTAAGDRDNSWGKAIGDGIQQGIEKGVTSAAETFGSRAADKVSGVIFKQPETESAGGSRSSGSADSSGSVEPPPTSGSPSGGAGGGKGGGAPPPKEGSGTKTTKGTPPPNKKTPAGPVQTGGTPTIPSKNCPKCGKPMTPTVIPADPNNLAGYKWMCPACGYKEADTVANPPAPPQPPAPPKPPEPPKGYKCPVCGSYNTTLRHKNHPLYGDVYDCHNCGNVVHDTW